MTLKRQDHKSSCVTMQMDGIVVGVGQDFFCTSLYVMFVELTLSTRPVFVRIRKIFS